MNFYITLILLAFYVYVLWNIIKDPYLTGSEKLLWILSIFVFSMIGIALGQLYSSAVMRKRFKLEFGQNTDKNHTPEI